MRSALCPLLGAVRAACLESCRRGWRCRLIPAAHAINVTTPMTGVVQATSLKKSNSSQNTPTPASVVSAPRKCTNSQAICSNVPTERTMPKRQPSCVTSELRSNITASPSARTGGILVLGASRFRHSLKCSELFPQVVDVHRNCIGLGQPIRAIDILKENVLGHEATLPSHELLQGRHFVSGEVDRVACNGCIARDRIERDVACGQHRAQHMPGSAQQGANASDKFFGRKRFHQIIIGTSIEALDAILDAVSC